MSTIKLKGSSSGEAEVTVAAAAGTPTFTLPTTVGSANQLVKNSGTAGTLEYSSGLTYNGSDLTLQSQYFYIKSPDGGNRYFFGETQNDKSAQLSLYDSSNTQKVRIAAGDGASQAETYFNGGNVRIGDGDLIIGTAGHGIDFSAQTQSSSTTDEELLDHYEKGKWTPDVRKNNVSNSTATVIHGRYVRIGKMVYLSMYARWNSGSSTQSSGGWQILGLPFALQDDDPGTCRIYQSAPSGYFMIDGNDYTSDNPRWQVNYSDKLDLYTNTSNSDLEWNSGMMAIGFTGCFMIHE